MNDGRLRSKDKRLTIDHGPWTMDDGRWTMDKIPPVGGQAKDFYHRIFTEFSRIKKNKIKER